MREKKKQQTQDAEVVIEIHSTTEFKRARQRARDHTILETPYSYASDSQEDGQ